MSIRILSPATIADAAECVGAVPYVTWAVIKLQLRLGESWAVRDEQDRTLMLAGIFPDDDGSREAWFIAGPLAGSRLIPLLKAIRLTLRPAAYRGIRAIVVTREGARIARVAGFMPARTVGGLEIWETAHDDNVRRQQQGGQRSESAGGGGAAEPAGAVGDAAGGGRPGEILGLAHEGAAAADLPRRRRQRDARLTSWESRRQPN